MKTSPPADTIDITKLNEELRKATRKAVDACAKLDVTQLSFLHPSPCGFDPWILEEVQQELRETCKLPDVYILDLVQYSSSPRTGRGVDLQITITFKRHLR